MRSAGGIGAITLLALVFGCMGPLPERLVGGTVEAQGQEPQSPNPLDEAIQISAESAALETGKPFRLKVTITNKSDRPLPLEFYPEVQLLKGDRDPRTDESGRDSFSGRVYFEPDAEFRKKGALIPWETISFDVDVTALKWGRSNSSFLPESKLFDVVPKGDYTLFVIFLTQEKEKRKSAYIYSNGLKVAIPSKQP